MRLRAESANANFGKLTSMHFYSWKAGLKTGMYYLRTKAATDAIKFTVDKAKLSEPAEANGKATVPTEKVRESAMAGSNSAEEAQVQIACSLDDPEGCEMCSG